jgi:hypothetical protein
MQLLTCLQLGTSFQFVLKQQAGAAAEAHIVPPRLHVPHCPEVIVACRGQDNTNGATGKKLLSESTSEHKGPQSV